jgi:hypothetical protein
MGLEGVQPPREANGKWVWRVALVGHNSAGCAGIRCIGSELVLATCPMNTQTGHAH